MKKIKKSNIIGIKKINKIDNKLYEKTSFFWKKISDINQSSKDVIQLYKNYNRQHILEDVSNDKFLKGHLTNEFKISGERIKTLPNGKQIARGGFSIFAKHLTINSNPKFEWDICYQNTSGSKTYLYSIDKLHLEQENKKKIVDEFKKNYKKIKERLENDLIEKKTLSHLGLYTILETLIRVGNHDYFNKTKHRGLTTLSKKNIKINFEKNIVIFDFIGKDGVYQHIEKEFPLFYIEILNDRLKSIKNDDFVFADPKNNPIHSKVFSDILFEYTNKHFYPHIIRSYYADVECEKFIQKSKGKKNISKEDVEMKFIEIASKLGHKKFDLKTNSWKIDPKVTIENYIYPEYSKIMKDMYSKKIKNI